MTQQGRTDKIDKQGIRIFAEFIENSCNWTFRETDSTDIGIDGEIEILDANLKSKSLIAKVQIKSEEEETNGDKIIKYVKKKHIPYWQNFAVPVLLVHVDNAMRVCYGVIVNPLLTYPETEKHHRVQLCTTHDLLNPPTLSRILGFDGRIRRPIDFKIHFDKVRAFFDEHVNNKYSHLEVEYADEEAIRRDREVYDEIEEHIVQINLGFAIFPWIRGKSPHDIVTRVEEFIGYRRKVMNATGPFHYS